MLFYHIFCFYICHKLQQVIIIALNSQLSFKEIFESEKKTSLFTLWFLFKMKENLLYLPASLCEVIHHMI